MKTFRPLTLLPKRLPRYGYAWLSSIQTDSVAANLNAAGAAPRHKARDTAHESAAKSPSVHDLLQDASISAHDRALDGASALALFREVVEEQTTPGSQPEQSQDGNATETLALYEKLAILQERLADPNASVASSWAYFVSDVYPSLVRRGFPFPRLFFTVHDLMKRKLVAAWQACPPAAASLPEVAQISRIWREMRLFDRKAWASMILGLTQAAASIKTLPDDYPSIESYEGSMGRRDALLRDLVRSWKLFYAPDLDAAKSRPFDMDGEPFRLHSIRAQQLRHLIVSRKSTLAFGALFPVQAPTRLGDELISASIASYVVLTDPSQRNRQVKEMAAPLVTAMGQVLKASSKGLKTVCDGNYARYPLLESYLKSRWPVAMKSWTSQDEGGLRSQPKVSKILFTDKALRRRLDEALKSRNVLTVDHLWADFWGHGDTPLPERTKQLQDASELFNHFGMVYMALKQPSKAITVWNAMGKIGLQPGLRTITSGMEGCRWARNPAGINTLWSRLIASRMKLDIAAWTARVSGLIEAGDAEKGLQALQELGKLWTEGKPDDPAYIKPSIEPVNAAIAALLRMRSLSAAQTVLRWAGQHGIEPDIYTYNTLLRPMIREGLDEEVDGLFQMMKAQGVRADVTTFTVILDSTLRGFASRPPQEQVDTVRRIFAQMEDAGVKPNMQTLAKMIYLLLQEGDRAAVAVKAVLAYIWGQGMEMTSHIYTMLADHYFSRDPPDLPAVKALIENRRLADNASIDHVFWEHIVVGYAEAGDDAQAWQAFQRLESSGAPVTLGTLEALLRCVLERSGAGEEAADVVRAARRHAERRKAGEGDGVSGSARYWRHRFWHLAKQHGLLDDEELARLSGSAANDS